MVEVASTPKPPRTLLRRMKLRHVLLLFVLFSSITPLLIASGLIIPASREVLEDAERDNLIRKAGTLSRNINDYLLAVRRQLEQLGGGLSRPPGPGMSERLRQPWLSGYLSSLRSANPDLVALQLRDADGAGPAVASPGLPAPALAELANAFEAARGGTTVVYRLVHPAGWGPLAVMAVPIVEPDGAPTQLVVEALLRFRPLEEVFLGESRGATGVCLLDRQGRLLWEDGGDPAMAQALVSSSDVVRTFVKRPMSFTREYSFSSASGKRSVLAQVSAIPDPGWGIVVQKPLSTAFAVIDQMVVKTAFATLPLALLSVLFALLAARWMGRPIQRLSETAPEIAEGSFGGRVEMRGLSFDLADLADDFNRMSDQVDEYVRQLRQAAQANRELFIGSLRAFAAAIDAKDPYTRGHSERVAAVSRVIARHLLLSEEMQHQVWIGALLHDVGKLGVEDTILRKEGELTADEYEQMKTHTVIGAEIMAPIEQLKEMLPAIRWHHESWNGRGYPDGLKGDQIPLIARIVAVADTFDAITTTRPYQQAAQMQYAVETITKLTGSRFDAKIVTA